MAAPTTTPVSTFGSVASIGARRQDAAVISVFAAATADGKGGFIDTRGINGAITIEVTKTGVGTFSLDIEGTLDNYDVASNASPLTPVGFAVLGSAGARTPAVTKAVGAGDPTTVALAVLDAFNAIRVNISGSAGAYSATARAFVEPQ